MNFNPKAIGTKTDFNNTSEGKYYFTHWLEGDRDFSYCEKSPNHTYESSHTEYTFQV